MKYVAGYLVLLATGLGFNARAITPDPSLPTSISVATTPSTLTPILSTPTPSPVPTIGFPVGDSCPLVVLDPPMSLADFCSLEDSPANCETDVASGDDSSRM